MLDLKPVVVTTTKAHKEVAEDSRVVLPLAPEVDFPEVAVASQGVLASVQAVDFPGEVSEVDPGVDSQAAHHSVELELQAVDSAVQDSVAVQDLAADPEEAFREALASAGAPVLAEDSAAVQAEVKP